MDPGQLPTVDEERRHYKLHENEIDDPGYRKFLSKLFDPMRQFLSSGMAGLDFGCGPGPVLAGMFEKAGYPMALFDPIFYPDEKALCGQYDFIVCTETAEHFHDPAREIDRLDMLLRPAGILGIMTCFQTDDAAFENWHYRKDPTHVVFYREETMRYIAASRGWDCVIPTKDVAIFSKPDAEPLERTPL
ncbi:MAG: class I SAM-dependent methyltransferase [Marinicaulis sp.]|nr:class I SAM-dependent methyltransferase [Marinicaulis sp.]